MDISDEDLIALDDLIGLLDEAEPISQQEFVRFLEEEKQREAEASAKRLNAMADGLPFDPPKPRTVPEFLTRARSPNDITQSNDDLRFQIGAVRAFWAIWLSERDFPPPAYPTRIAVILRKHKRRDLEFDFLRSFMRHFDGIGLGESRGYRKLRERAAKLGALRNS